MLIYYSKNPLDEIRTLNAGLEISASPFAGGMEKGIDNIKFCFGAKCSHFLR